MKEYEPVKHKRRYEPSTKANVGERSQTLTSPKQHSTTANVGPKEQTSAEQNTPTQV